MNDCLLGKDEQPLDDGPDLLLEVLRAVAVTGAAGEERVTGNENAAGQQTDTARSMARRMDDANVASAQCDLFAVS